MMPRLPQPIPYQGSKRKIAAQILRAFPTPTSKLIEPFAGSAAVSVAAAYHGRADSFHLHDLNKPLMDLLRLIIEKPQQIADEYERLWQAQLGRRREFYDQVRAKFNRHHRPDHFLYLLARCVKASVRYNAAGEFNQSPDNRRKGRRPDSMRKQITAVSKLLNGKTTITSGNYTNTLEFITPGDLVYMDPPYQGTSGNRDPRYYSGVSFDNLVDFLRALNDKESAYLLSYDGRTGSKTYGRELPSQLNLYHFEIDAGRSSQSTLLGKRATTYESLYLSPALVTRLQSNDVFNEGKRQNEQISNEN